MKKFILTMLILTAMVSPCFALNESFNLTFETNYTNVTTYTTFEGENANALNTIIILFGIGIVIVVAVIAIKKSGHF